MEPQNYLIYSGCKSNTYITEPRKQPSYSYRERPLYTINPRY